jgi:anti-sigma factor RsiW
VKVSAAHLKDEHLFECYLSARIGDAVDPRMAEHLADCRECVARFDELTSFMDASRAEADAETDEVFPAERLVAQHDRVMQRIEHVHRSARVISFPGREPAGPSRGSLHLTPRWLAAAAAAGLFIGAVVGGYFAPARLHRATQSQALSAPAVAQPRTGGSPAVLVTSSQPEFTDDDAFLLQLEMALARPSTRELLPYDALTPHVRDIDTRAR